MLIRLLLFQGCGVFPPSSLVIMCNTIMAYIKEVCKYFWNEFC